MSELTTKDAVAMIAAISKRMTEMRDHLCELDGHIGDADHGIAMSQGFAAARDAVSELDASTATLTDVFNTTAKSFLNAVGASSGPLYATAFMRLGKHLGGAAHCALTDTPAFFSVMAQGIGDRGKAEPGEKTMIDAWAPAAAQAEKGGDLKESLSAIRRAAEEGADETKDMIATKGRSARLGERSRGHVDPGAVSAAMIIRTLTEELERMSK